MINIYWLYANKGIPIISPHGVMAMIWRYKSAEYIADINRATKTFYLLDLFGEKYATLLEK